MTAISVGDTQLVRQSLTYQQDAADRITRITNGIDAAATQTYAYDKLDRLVQENAQVYEYDANGNRWRSGAARHVEDTSNRLLQSGDLSFAYDANGNTTQWTLHGQTPVVTYDAFQRTQRITIDDTSHEYEYDALDQRVGKRAPSGAATRYFRDGHRLMAEVDAQGRWTTYVWLGDTLIGFVRDGGLYYVHTDHLGRPESMTAHDRSYVWRARNGAFGRDAVLVERVGAFNIGLPGQYFDAESGIWQNGRRDYAEATGRYLQTDPIGLSAGLNPYAYVSGNPISRIDPLGLKGYDQCEVEALLAQERNGAESAPLVAMATLFNNHRAGGTFDFAHNQPVDTFNVRGTIYNSSQFGNFIAGYGGAYFGGPTGVGIVKGAGFAMNLMEGSVNALIGRQGRQVDGDRGSRTFIDAGAKTAYGEMASSSGPGCGCPQ